MRLIIDKRKDFPKCLQPFKQVKGICIGTCKEHSGRRIKDVAHAHCDQHPYPGWICLRGKYLLKNEGILLHEAAHIIAGNIGNIWHGKEWKRMVVAIGGTFKSIQVARGRSTIDYTHRYR